MNDTAEASHGPEPRGLSVFEKYLTLWVVLCIVGGIALGRLAPGVARSLDAMAIHVGEDDAPVVSIPIAVCLFSMMYPIMVKSDFAEVVKAGKSLKPVGLTLFLNWAIKPFTMYAIATFFLGTVFYGLIGPDAVDYVRIPLGLDLPVGATHASGTVVLVDGVKMLEVPLWLSFRAGCILLGIAPCTAMVLVWGYLAKGNDGHTLVMVAINSLTMLVLYGLLGGWLLKVGRLPVPWQALLLSIAIYVALPLVAGYVTRKWILAARGEARSGNHRHRREIPLEPHSLSASPIDHRDSRYRPCVHDDASRCNEHQIGRASGSGSLLLSRGAVSLFPTRGGQVRQVYSESTR